MTRFMPDTWTLPAIEPRTKDFFTSGKILLQQCESCEHIQHPPDDVCHRCQGMTFGTKEFEGLGTVYSFTVIRHPVDAVLVDRLPYTVVLVSLDEQPDIRIVGNILDVEPEEVTIGMPVRAVWEEATDPASGEKLLLPQWKLRS